MYFVAVMLCNKSGIKIIHRHNTREETEKFQFPILPLTSHGPWISIFQRDKA